jgi:hypothetical protein
LPVRSGFISPKSNRLQQVDQKLCPGLSGLAARRRLRVPGEDYGRLAAQGIGSMLLAAAVIGSGRHAVRQARKNQPQRAAIASARKSLEESERVRTGWQAPIEPTP